MLQLLGFLIALVIVGSYLVSVRTGNRVVFDWSEAIGSLLLVPIYMTYDAYFGAFISAAFSAVGWYGISHRSVSVGPKTETL